MVPASSPTHVVRCGMGAAGSGSYLGAGREGWGAGQGAAAPPELPEPRTPSFAAATATATTAVTHGSRGRPPGAGSSSTDGWIINVGPGEGCRCAVTPSPVAGPASHHVPSPWHRALALPVVGGTKGPFRHPQTTGATVPTPPSPRCARASRRQGSTRGVCPRGLGGCTQCWVPLGGGCQSREWLGVAPPHPRGWHIRHLHTPPSTSAADKRLKVRLCQLPSPGTVGVVTTGRAPALCPPQTHMAAPATCHCPGVPSWCWHRAARQHHRASHFTAPAAGATRRVVASQKQGRCQAGG